MENLPEKKGEKKTESYTQNSKTPLLAQIKHEIHIGPLPPPETLELYSKIDPSFPERIVRMAEKEQHFRHKSYLIGQISAVVIVVAGLASATYLGINGKEWLGGTIGLGALASIVGAYFYSQRMQKHEQEH